MTTRKNAIVIPQRAVQELQGTYNVFVVGRIWHSARDRPLRAAVADTAPQAARAIAPAGLALALSFALLAVVPLRPFRELAFALAVGVLLETFVVRALLVPALIAIFGPLSRWPAKRRLAAGGSADAIIPS